MAFFGELKAAAGSIVNVTSIPGSGVHPFAGSNYTTLKAALVVCVKQVPGSAQIRVHPVTNTIMRQGVPTIVSA
ncbi:NAD(P)-dependent dehydrogenase (short-subunit alcohol dehydrogenase family) [Bradyrhizobium sp. LB14.3]